MVFLTCLTGKQYCDLFWFTNSMTICDLLWLPLLRATETVYQSLVRACQEEIAATWTSQLPSPKEDSWTVFVALGALGSFDTNFRLCSISIYCSTISTSAAKCRVLFHHLWGGAQNRFDWATPPLSAQLHWLIHIEIIGTCWNHILKDLKVNKENYLEVATSAFDIFWLWQTAWWHFFLALAFTSLPLMERFLRTIQITNFLWRLAQNAGQFQDP